eukprot:GHVO01036122.1.p1 GENE.GHVO01036122.1~~GHVO01036122.1.p1  ORF type:complete len:108 (+),score=17.81 GHVO01036122.1:23-346(+)
MFTGNTFSRCTALLTFSVLLLAPPPTRAEDSLYHLSSAAASSTMAGEEGGDFDANRALQPGSGYWCSEAHTADTDVVTWGGVFRKPILLSSLRVRWAYSPREVSGPV